MWRERGIRAWGEGWWEMPVTVGDQIGRIIGAPPGTTVMHQNVTDRGGDRPLVLPQPGARNRVVYEEANFPSVRYLYQAQPDLEVVAVEDDGAIVDAIDERTLLVPISHVLFKNGEIQESSRSCGARTRSARTSCSTATSRPASCRSTSPRSTSTSPSAAASSGSAAGRAPAGCTCGPDLAERLEPTFVGWQGHARPFAFEPELEYAAGARRFLTGTPNVPALYAATAGYDVIEEVGVDRIRERSLALTQLLIDRLDDAGFEVGEPARAGPPRRHRARADAGRRGRASGARRARNHLRLPPRRRRSGSGRTSTTREDELEATVDELTEIVASGAYERHAGAAARF